LFSVWSLRRLLLLVPVVFLFACQREGKLPEDIPTPIRSLDELATAQVMTANAPPEGFRGPVTFPFIDENLPNVPNWRAEVLMRFNGVYASTPRPAIAETRATLWYNDLGPERRVVIEGEGALFGQEEATMTLEGVRLAEDAFLVRENTCVGQAEGTAQVADLRAGELIGGVTNAVTRGVNAIINGEQVWRYDFAPEDLNLPQLDFREDSRIVAMNGELWVAPEHDAVIRYYLLLNVENVIVRLDSSETPLPVSGDLVIRYDVFDIGINPNITQPFGC